MTFCMFGSLALLPLQHKPASALQSGTDPAHRANFQALGSKFVLVFQVIEVKFEKLDLEPDTYCRYDYVALFNGGETDNSRRIGKFCGDRAPG